MKHFNSGFHRIPTLCLVWVTFWGCAQSKIAALDAPACDDEIEACNDDLGLTVDSMIDSNVDAAPAPSVDVSMRVDMQIDFGPDTSMVMTVDMSTGEITDAEREFDALAEPVDAQQPTCQDSNCAVVNNGTSACVNDRCETTCDNGFSLQDSQCVDIDECATNHGNCGADSHYECENLVGQPLSLIHI